MKKNLSAKRSHFLTIVPDPIPLNCLRSSCTVDPTCAADGANFQHSRKVKPHVSLPRRCSLPSQTSPKRPHALSHLATYLLEYHEHDIPQGPPTKPRDILQLTSVPSLPSQTLQTTISATLVVWNTALPVRDSGDSAEAPRVQALQASPPSLETPVESGRDRKRNEVASLLLIA